MEKSKREIMAYILLAMFIAGVSYILANAFAGMFPGGEKIFMTGDLYIQYAPLNRLFWKSFLQGKPLDYSFSLGAGMPSIAVYAFYCLSPIQIIFALIEDADIAAILVATIKLMLASEGFCYYALRYLHATPSISISAAVFYALCGYACSYSFYLTFLDALYIMPILIMCVIRAVKQEKFALMSICYAYSFVTLFYTGYMLGIFSALVFGLILIMFGRKKRILPLLIKFFFCVLVAALLSMVVILPTAVYLFGNLSDDRKVFAGLGVTISGTLLNLYMGRFQGYAGHLPMIYCGTLSIISFPLFFLNRWIEIKKKIITSILLIFLGLCVFEPHIYLMIHAFDMPDGFDYRFTYMISFVLLSMMCVTLKRNEVHVYEVIVSSAIYFMAYGVLLCIGIKIGTEDGINLMEWGINTVFIAIWSVFILLLLKKKGCVWIAGLLALLETMVNLYMMQTPDEDGFLRKASLYHVWKVQAEETIKELKKNDDGFWRLYYENALFANDSAFFGYRGVGYFLSVENQTLRYFFNTMGLATSSRVVCDYGSSPALRMLMSQKYMIHGTDPRYEGVEDYKAIVNPYSLPLGFMVSDNILNYKAGDNPFENQNRLLSLMCDDENIIVYDVYTDNAEKNSEGIELIGVQDRWLFKKDANRTIGRYVFRIPYREGQRAYIYIVPRIKGLWQESALLVSERGDTGMIAYESLLSFAHILQMETDDSGMEEAAVYMTDNTVQEQEYKVAYFAYFLEKGLHEAYDKLSSKGMNVISFKDNEIDAEITVTKENEILFTSIPYDDGWHIMDNGSEIDTQPILEGAFLGASLSEGTHSLHITYSNRWAQYGFIATCIGGVLLIVVLWVDTFEGRKIEKCV